MPKHPAPRVRRYQYGGTVDPNYTSKMINQGFDTTRNAIATANAMKTLMGSVKGDASAPADSSMSGGAGPGNPTAGARKGGPIRKTMGSRLGREDGLIAAQKGEYVVRKSAAKKLGKATLDTINKGKLPHRKGAR